MLLSSMLFDLVKDRNQNEPYLIIFGVQQTPQQCFLIVDQEILCEIDEDDCAFALMSAFFVFNICYTKGLSNVFTFFEHVLLNINHSKLSPSVSHYFYFITSIICLLANMFCNMFIG
jgi:hypothetical protein